MATTRFTQLEVWKKAHQAVLDVYRLTTGFPADERFTLVSQMRRAAISIPANIAEGYGRRAPRDKARCYTIGQGSNEEGDGNGRPEGRRPRECETRRDLCQPVAGGRQRDQKQQPEARRQADYLRPASQALVSGRFGFVQCN